MNSWQIEISVVRPLFYDEETLECTMNVADFVYL